MCLPELILSLKPVSLAILNPARTHQARSPHVGQLDSSRHPSCISDIFHSYVRELRERVLAYPNLTGRAPLPTAIAKVAALTARTILW
jgi:hypothetical protein